MSQQKTDTTVMDCASFQNLTPDIILNSIEAEIGERLSGLLSPFPSYINRVYEIETSAGQRLVAKFYRPGRWTREAVIDEHDFILDCHNDEIPVIPPIKLSSGSTLAETHGIAFCIFPKKGGREMEFTCSDDWKRAGMLIGRLHLTGLKSKAENRIILHPAKSTLNDINYLLANGNIPDHLKENLKNGIYSFIDYASPFFDRIKMGRIHGDCHIKNILHRPGEGMMMIDFDDMMNGPSVQDLWLLLPGTADTCKREINLLLEGYETFMEFDDSLLQFTESLRIMRMIYFLAWCCRQRNDNHFRKTFPDWGSENFWQTETRELQQQISKTLKK